MKFAVNYSPQARNAIASGAFCVDRYKVPDWRDLINEVQTHHPVYVHFSLHTGRGTLGDADFDEIERLRIMTDTPYVNTHIATGYGLAGIAYDNISPIAIERLYDATMRDIEPLIERWGADNIIIENAPTSPSDRYHIALGVIQPDFITRVVEACDAGFLLDTAHAWIASDTLGMRWREYLDGLPVQHLRELHVTGIQAVVQEDENEPPVYNDHFAMRDADWLSAEYALDSIKSGAWSRPWMVALEYGGVGMMFEWRSEQPVLERDGARLMQLCK